MSENITNNEVKMDVPYFQVPNKIFDVDELSIYEKMVYMYLARCGNQGSTAFPSYQTIADKCGMCRRKAIDSVKKLKGIGLLQKESRKVNKKYNKSNIYEVIPPSECHALGSAYDAPGSEQYAPNKELCNKEILDKENTKGNQSYDLISWHTFKTNNEPGIFEEDIYDAIDYYLEVYEDIFNKKHPDLKEITWINVINSLRIIEDKSYDRHASDISYEQYTAIIDKHFNTNYQDNCDYHIPHFAQNDILKNRYFEVNGDY